MRMLHLYLAGKVREHLLRINASAKGLFTIVEERTKRSNILNLKVVNIKADQRLRRMLNRLKNYWQYKPTVNRNRSSDKIVNDLEIQRHGEIFRYLFQIFYCTLQRSVSYQA